MLLRGETAEGRHRERGKLSTGAKGYPQIMGTYPQNQENPEVLRNGPGR